MGRAPGRAEADEWSLVSFLVESEAGVGGRWAGDDERCWRGEDSDERSVDDEARDGRSSVGGGLGWIVLDLGGIA
jgi:hypothetical protein